ncbi:hypothetical protein MSj_04234 [Microcystis aeruginosa Sj]|uniref:Uncharacterized protein n=1 Tax=Microcystis aeruginosa Sj TaxID=1979544 RepID=A0A2Z6UVI7_MICAE|nr:hypothetical protein MSj_04234 [Microcystis aeruginosa Sj]
MRKAVGGKPEPEEYQQKKAQLEEFKQLENAGKIGSSVIVMQIINLK